LGGGHINKLILRFSEELWPQKSADLGILVSDGLIGAWWGRPATNAGVEIVGFLGGRRALEAAALTEDQRIARGLSELGAVFGDKLKRLFISGQFVNWSADPFTRGGYSFNSITTAHMREVLAAPIHDTIFFAGEATRVNGDHGTIHGALETGWLAADMLMREGYSEVDLVRKISHPTISSFQSI
jgi:monoamine oxidase